MQIETILTATGSALAGASVAFWLFYRKRKYELLDQKRKAAPKFLAKINTCLFDAKQKANESKDCVCHESYAEFRLTLAGAEATELEKCWNTYIVELHTGIRCIESLECLHRLVHKYTETRGSQTVMNCATCAA